MAAPVNNGNHVEAQALPVKRAQVEFHNFASLGEPERAFEAYRKENVRRGALIRSCRAFAGELSPFLEIGANAGHTSYMLVNEFGASGFALDISAGALRHGIALMDKWKLERAPVRIAGDALNLPFRDGSLRFVMTHQTLSQLLDLDAVFAEVNRVLAPGGVFFFSEEPIRRILSLRLFRAPYYETMKPWERKLYDSGWLGFLVKDVIGAHQEESFGIRQNHNIELLEWDALIRRHFAEREFDISVPQRGWPELAVMWIGRHIDRYGSDWVPARLLGGTLAAFCRKAGKAEPMPSVGDRFETLLRCPDCHASLSRGESGTLACECGYSAADEDGVYNLLCSKDRGELYPGDRSDVIDFTLPGHEARLVEGWEPLEGVYGNRYRWIGKRAVARLQPVRATPQRLRIRGFAHEKFFEQNETPRVAVSVNGTPLREFGLDRSGLFVLEADVPDALEYLVEVKAGPVWKAPPDEREFTVNLSMLRLVDR